MHAFFALFIYVFHYFRRRFAVRHRDVRYELFQRSHPSLFFFSPPSSESSSSSLSSPASPLGRRPPLSPRLLLYDRPPQSAAASPFSFARLCRRAVRRHRLIACRRLAARLHLAVARSRRSPAPRRRSLSPLACTSPSLRRSPAPRRSPPSYVSAVTCHNIFNYTLRLKIGFDVRDKLRAP